jgi:hypothetical protein
MQHVLFRRVTGVTLAGMMFVAAIAAFAPGAAAASTAKVHYTVHRSSLHYVGSVNLRAAARSMRTSGLRTFQQGSSLAIAPSGLRFGTVDQAIVNHRLAAKTGAAQAATAVAPGEVAGESGFFGLNGEQQAVANGNLDLEPPDQGLCAGGGYIGEFINNALTFYDTNGIQEENTLPSYAFFKQPSTDFFSDPRCYYDTPTKRWIFIEFIAPIFTSTAPSTQFIAVSDSPDPLGSWTIWSIPTSDNSTAGCPCFGDFDQLGVDDNGIYISTNEFNNAGTAYNGVIIYAVSKQTVENFSTTGIPPTVFSYRVPTDMFGQTYHIAPSETPPGAGFAPNTEYFVESNPDAFSDDHLEVYAMTSTSLLAQPAAPPLTNVYIPSQSYTFPPDATQKAGPIPLGNANEDPEGELQSDFDAIQEVTYTHGEVYAEADTAVGTRNGAAWFEITPKVTSTGLTATVANQGVVTVSGQSVIYPVIALNSAGNGYMAFTLSGPRYYPSAAYVGFTTGSTSTGPTGDVYIAAPGADPEDSFTCYAAFVGPNYGGCRWGDYSMGVAMGSKVYLATEVVPPTSRDYLTNWGTFVWGAPAP